MLERSREFIELSVRLNYTVAAEKLHLSTSALSRHIADLETELGFALFNRSPLSLTQAGQFYLESISSLIDEFDAIVDKGRKIAELSFRSFCVYTLPSRAPFANAVYDAAAALRRGNEGLETSMCVDDRFLTIEEALASGKADVGVVYECSVPETDDIALVPYAEAPIAAWVRRDSPLAEKEAVSLIDLADFAHPKSTNRQSLAGTNSVERLFDSVGISLKMRLRNLQDWASFFLTLKKDEFVMGFDSDDEPTRINPDLVKLRFSSPITRTILLAYKRDCSDPLVFEFVELCQRIAREKGLTPKGSAHLDAIGA